MFNKSICSTSIIAIIFLFCGSQTFAVKEVTVTATGKSIIMNGNVDNAKVKARNEAIRNAVEQGAGMLVDSETFQSNFHILQDRIFASSRGFIKSFETLHEGVTRGGSAYEVKIRAIVSSEKLEKVMTSIEGLRMQQRFRGNKSVIVLYDPRASGARLPLKFDDPNEQEVILKAIGEINRVLLEKQFKIFDESRLLEVNMELHKFSDYADFDARALRLAQSNSADLLLTFRLINYIKKDSRISWSKSEFSAKAVYSGSGQLIGSSRKVGKASIRNDSTAGDVYLVMVQSSLNAATPATEELARQMLVTQPLNDTIRLLFSKLSVRQKRAVKSRISRVTGYHSHKILAEKRKHLDIELQMEPGTQGNLSLNVSEIIEADKSFTKKDAILDSECQRNRCAFTVINDE